MRKLGKIENKVIVWNNRFPIDRWWRDKHNVPFMSSVHRESNFIDQLFEYYEDQLVSEANSDSEDKYVPNSGDFIKLTDKKSRIQSMSEEFDKEFGIDG